MAPAVHPSGPSGAYTIAGALSYESLFMVNGVTANENVRGQAVQPVHRRRHPGNGRGHRRGVGGIRPVQRRNREHHHQIGHECVPRVVPRHAQQRRLASADRRQRELRAAGLGSNDRAVQRCHRDRRDADSRSELFLRGRQGVEGGADVRVRVWRPDCEGPPHVLHCRPVSEPRDRAQHGQSRQSPLHHSRTNESATRSK